MPLDFIPLDCLVLLFYTIQEVYGKFVAVAYNSNYAAYSLNGTCWTETSLLSSANWNSVTYGDGKFVAVAYNSKGILTRRGFTQWTMAQQNDEEYDSLWEDEGDESGEVQDAHTIAENSEISVPEPEVVAAEAVAEMSQDGGSEGL